MATGRLGAVDLAANTETVLYTCPSGNFAVATLNVCNRSSSSVTVRVALAASTTAVDSEWLEFDVEILPKGVLERTGIVMDQLKNIIVRSNATGVSAVCYGIETPTA